jgi:hypothetical protein
MKKDKLFKISKFIIHRVTGLRSRIQMFQQKWKVRSKEETLLVLIPKIQLSLGVYNCHFPCC